MCAATASSQEYEAFQNPSPPSLLQHAPCLRLSTTRVYRFKLEEVGFCFIFLILLSYLSKLSTKLCLSVERKWRLANNLEPHQLFQAGLNAKCCNPNTLSGVDSHLCFFCLLY